jgi:hypothetical protein
MSDKLFFFVRQIIFFVRQLFFILNVRQIILNVRQLISQPYCDTNQLYQTTFIGIKMENKENIENRYRNYEQICLFQNEEELQNWFSPQIEQWTKYGKYFIYDGRKKACPHGVMIMVLNGTVDYPPEVMAELIGKRSKKGRPKKVKGGTALIRN